MHVLEGGRGQRAPSSLWDELREHVVSRSSSSLGHGGLTRRSVTGLGRLPAPLITEHDTPSYWHSLVSELCWSGAEVARAQQTHVSQEACNPKAFPSNLCAREAMYPLGSVA